MPVALRIAVKASLVLTAVCALALAVIWPWPAPEVDWRSPVDAALAKNNCERVTAILNAATEAGAIEAYDMLAKPASPSPCFDAPTLPMYPDRAAAALRFARRTGGRPPLSDAVTALDLWLRNYVRITDFLCRQPYDTGTQTDHVVISSALPEEAGWLLALHRQRRDVCSGIVGNLATALAERDEPQAKELAYAFAMGAPVTGSTTSDIVPATLLVEQQFVPRFFARRDPHRLTLMRGSVWDGLQRAAEAADPRAIDMMISLLHQRRFLQYARFLEGAPEEAAYFWILRSRRLRLPTAQAHAAIERALDAGARSKVKKDEEFDWQFRQSLPSRSR
jgi:hypothetical protein